MMPAINGVMLSVSSSFAASIVAKATLITLLGLIGAWLARHSRAAMRHAILAASFIALFALPIASLLAPPVRIAVSQGLTDASRLPAAIDETQLNALRNTTPDLASSVAQRPMPPLGDVLLAVWITGAILFLLRIIIGLRQVRSLRRFGLPWRGGQSIVERLALDAGIHRRVEVLLHESLSAPVTCGLIHPAIVLPPDAQNWDSEDLNRAIVHELEHVRRGDWFSHCLARAVRAAWWFHPFVWIAWRQLALEAERSCDDAVLKRSEATVYADQLVELAKRLSAAGKSPALAMANRSDLSVRVRAVLDSRQQRGRAGAILVALACAAAAVVIVAISPLVMVAAQSQVAPAPMPATAPKYDVASIKPNNDNDFRFVFRFEPGGRLAATGITLRRLMMTAYQVQGFRIIGGPDWMSSKQWDIQATPDRAASPAQVWPMLRALLESRFQLHAHSETRQLPVYELIVDQSGSKVPAVKDPEATPEVRNGRGSIQLTHNTAGTFSNELSYALDRPVIDKTNLSGQFDFALRWSPAPGEDGGPTGKGLPPHAPDQPAAAPDGPSIFTALTEQLGLRLKSARGPVKVIVIDSLELPGPN